MKILNSILMAMAGGAVLLGPNTASIAATSIAATADRVLHVSPQPLTGIATAHQFRTINEAAKAVTPGDTVLIHGGTYRETVTVAASGTAQRPIRFMAALAANVIVTGADRLEEWRKEENTGADNVYSTAWPHRFITWSKAGTHPGDDYHALIGRAEQVFIDDYPLQQVLRRELLGRGTFYVDVENKRLYVHASNNAGNIGKDPIWSPRVEAATRGVLWESKGDYVHLRGIRFRYAANQAQQAAAQFRGRGSVVEDCVFERTNSIGASFLAPDIVARRCTFQDNGQMGWSATRAHNLLVTECLTRGNNTKGFNRNWEAGGDKIVLCRGVVIEKSRFVDNRGIGIWFDIGNEANTVRNCLIADNEDAGIFYEISYGLHAHDNVIVGNGLAGNAGAWGAAGGIALSSSPDCVIERNLIVGNKEGFNFREQGRTTWRLGFKEGVDKEVAIWNHDEVIRNNVLAYNRDAQTWGWFDLKDESHWPRAMQARVAPSTGDNKPGADMAAEYKAKGETGKPTDLSLEKLNFTFANNLYATTQSQGLFNWGTEWRRHVNYENLNAVRDELKLEQGSIVAPFVFGDYLTRDFRVPRDSPALKLHAYPRGEVPGARLGTL